MSGWLLPLAATAAAGGLTYVFCMRPMLKGRRCAMGSPRPEAESMTALDEQIAAAHAELAALRDATAKTEVRPVDASRHGE